MPFVTFSIVTLSYQTGLFEMNSSASYSILTVGEFVIEAHITNHFGFLISDKNSLTSINFLRCCHVERAKGHCNKVE